ncbi:MAG TPA: hypothetical protein PKX87_09305, partial [Alphaproteobacteria bacterium]|nr:hypothetical protein [Alphaproteobacteria bacterium]
METKETQTAGSGTSTHARRHGPGEGQRYLTDLLQIGGSAAPAWLRDLDETIVRYAERVSAHETHKIAGKIHSLQEDLARQKAPADGRAVDWAVLSQLEGDIKGLRRSVRHLYSETYQTTWESLLTRNGTRLMTDVVSLPSAAQVFPTEGKTKLLKIALSEKDPEQAQHAFKTTLNSLWPEPKAQVVSVRREAPVPAGAPAPQDVFGAEKPDSPVRDLETRGVPVDRALVPVSDPVAPRAEGRGWGRRILGTLFNAAAGAGAGMA